MAPVEARQVARDVENPMSTTESKPTGPDLASGISVDDLPDASMLVGHVGEEAVLLARRGNEFFAIGANCSHYGGPLAEGLMVEDTVRCPWHHACFSLRTGEALQAPLSPVACWAVEQRDGKIFVQNKKEMQEPKRKRSAAPAPASPEKIVIVGGGAAGFAAAEKLRREQYQGNIVMLSSDDAPPVDRPNLSKDYLAGNAPEEWVPLRPVTFYSEHAIDLRLKSNVAAIDVRSCKVVPMGTKSLLTACCLQPALSRSACRSQAPTSRTCAHYARSPTVGPSSSVPRRPAGRWCWVRALSD
jgi:nitrite reductase/ring-hydroxylating ferredoxin subunit